jgi:hypothetical protein
MPKCENHPDRTAQWFRNSWLWGSDPVPVCDQCKNHYVDLRLDKALNVRLISGGTQGQGEINSNEIRPV